MKHKIGQDKVPFFRNLPIHRHGYRRAHPDPRRKSDYSLIVTEEMIEINKLGIKLNQSLYNPGAPTLVRTSKTLKALNT